MKPFRFPILLMLLLLILSACGKAGEKPTDTTPSTDTVPSDSETRAETLSDTAPGTEAPAETDPDDGFDAVRASEELWLSYGLDAYLAGKESPDLTDFFAEPGNLVYLTLYADMFCYDKAKTVPVAEDFFRFVVERYGKDALLDPDKRIEYKSAYLDSLGVKGGYPQDPAMEALLSRMTLSSEKDWRYVLTVDNTAYYLNDFGQGSISQYHALFYYNNRALDDLVTYIEAHIPSTELDTDRRFAYYLTFDGTGVSFTLPDGRMSINEMYSMLHESLHAMGLSADKDEYLWLVEGLCNYLGKSMGFNPQYAAATVQILKLAESGYFDERAEAGDVSAIFYKRLFEAYTAAGGSTASAEELDLILYNDLYAVLEREVLGEQTPTIADVYKGLNGRDYTAPGTDLTYAEATALVTWLVDTYGIDKVTEAAQKEDVKGVLGKTYEELSEEQRIAGARE